MFNSVTIFLELLAVLSLSMLFGCYATSKRDVVFFIGALVVVSFLGKEPLKSLVLLLACVLVATTTYYYAQRQNRFSFFVNKYIRKIS